MAAYIIDLSRLQKNLNLLADVQQRADVHLLLALKAYAGWRLFPKIGAQLSGASASSLWEARLIYEEMGIKAHTYCPVLEPERLSELLHYSSHLTFNSLSEYERHITTIRTIAPQLLLGLRINPGYSDVTTVLYNPSHPRSRLGIPVAKLPDRPPAGISGVHVHTLCESPAASSLKLLATVEEQLYHWLPRLHWINLGGGHLMTRTGYDLDALIAGLKAFRKRHPYIAVHLEPGSAILWQTGELSATVRDVVPHGGQATALLDVSFTAHMPDTLEMPYRPVVRGSVPLEQATHTYRLGGNSCLAGDFLEAYGFAQPLEVGQSLVFEDMIHYTMVKSTFFNGVQHPDIIHRHLDGREDVVRRFDYLDYKSRLG